LPDTMKGLTVHARVVSLENKLLAEKEEKKDAPTGTTEVFALDLVPQIKANVVLVKLELRDAAGKLISDNFYWIGGESADYRKLNRLAAVDVAVTAGVTQAKDGVHVKVHLQNKGTIAAIQTKLTLLAADGATRVLPAYYGDNYISLLPGEEKDIEIEVGAVKGGLSLGIRGWNVAGRVLKLVGGK
jgi:hypothetical protein